QQQETGLHAPVVVYMAALLVLLVHRVGAGRTSGRARDDVEVVGDDAAVDRVGVPLRATADRLGRVEERVDAAERAVVVRLHDPFRRLALAAEVERLVQRGEAALAA